MLIKLNILAFIGSDVAASDLKAAVAGVDGMELTIRPLAAGALTTQTGNGDSADVLIIESDGSDMNLAVEVEEFVAKLPEGVVALVLGDTSNPALLRRLMRAGVKDVLALPVVRQDVVAALINLLAEKRESAMARGENVTSICVFTNAKGGSGSTTLVVNVACALAARHKARVAVLDFDMQFGDCAMSLDLAPQNNISDALAQAERIDPVLLKALMTEHASGVHVLASPSSLTARHDADAQSVRRVIDAAALAYDVVLVDLPRQVAGWTVEAMKASTTTFIVLQNNLATIRDARMLVDHLPRAGVEARRIELVNNRAMSKAPSVSIEQLKETLKHDRVHRIRNDFKTASAAEDQGIPVNKVDAHSDLAQDIDHLADYIWAAHGHGPTKKEGFFQKWFGTKPAAADKNAKTK